MWVKVEGFRCPVRGCPASRKIFDWCCAADSAPVWINEKAVMECTSGAHTGLMKDWRWNCGSHNGKYLPSDGMAYTYAVSVATQLMEQAEAEWYKGLMRELAKQY